MSNAMPLARFVVLNWYLAILVPYYYEVLPPFAVLNKLVFKWSYFILVCICKCPSGVTFLCVRTRSMEENIALHIFSQSVDTCSYTIGSILPTLYN